MDAVKVRNISIGEGLPKICVPVMGRTEEEILAETRAVLEVPADMAEWRADWYEECHNRQKTWDILKKIRAMIGGMPLIMTFRTSEEGGELPVDPETYRDLCIDAIRSGSIDLIDVELSCGEETAKEIIEEARSAGVRTVASSHDFERTPDKSEITGRLLRMRDLGADILKIAVMPENRQDVAVLLEAASDAADRTGKPLIAISMGKLGVMSRIACEAFGSSVTFAAASRASAPGQPGAAELRDLILRLHDMI
ncbi:MAG: type I 3-dehydroquinate dehydratase [Mogibacterium sp.]|nr:type I 3-dehydroquinate dehydratase [Mogibacterium sp.]